MKISKKKLTTKTKYVAPHDVLLLLWKTIKSAFHVNHMPGDNSQEIDNLFYTPLPPTHQKFIQPYKINSHDGGSLRVNVTLGMNGH